MYGAHHMLNLSWDRDRHCGNGTEASAGQVSMSERDSSEMAGQEGRKEEGDESLLGLLQHAAKVVQLGRRFTRKFFLSKS